MSSGIIGPVGRKIGRPFFVYDGPGMPVNSKPSEADDIALLRRTFDVARRAQTRGNHPFAALLVSAEGDVLIEMENGFMPDRDMTGHAERLLATQACKTCDPQAVARATMYCSA